MKSSRKPAHSKAAAYWKSEINKAGGNARSVWRTVDNLHGKTKSSAITRFAPDDYHDFIDSKIMGVRAATATAALPIFTSCATPDLAAFTTVNVDDVIRAIRISPLKQCASDPLPTWLLKECASTVAPFITRILNMSLTGGDFPSPWKHAIVTPLLKKAGLDDSIVSSYRPVSNLSHLSKIRERIVHHHVISHLEEFKLLPDFQSAYRHGHSTETAALKVYTDLINAISNGNFALLSLLDLTTAFDTVDHNILLHRLEITFSFCGIPLQ